MFKTVSLPADTWAKLVRKLTVEVGSDDESRKLAGAITEQINGSVKVRATSKAVHFKAGPGGDLRGMLGLK